MPKTKVVGDQKAQGEITLEAYLTGCALQGLLASQVEEPDKTWAASWAVDVAIVAAKKLRDRQERLGPR